MDINTFMAKKRAEELLHGTVKIHAKKKDISGGSSGSSDPKVALWFNKEDVIAAARTYVAHYNDQTINAPPIVYPPAYHSSERTETELARFRNLMRRVTFHRDMLCVNRDAPRPPDGTWYTADDVLAAARAHAAHKNDWSYNSPALWFPPGYRAPERTDAERAAFDSLVLSMLCMRGQFWVDPTVKNLMKDD